MDVVGVMAAYLPVMRVCTAQSREAQRVTIQDLNIRCIWLQISTSIRRGLQNRHRMWSPELTSHVVPRNFIVCGPQKWHRMCSPEMPSLTTAKACGSQNCYCICSTELSSHLVHRINILMSSPPLLSYVGPQLSSHGPQNYHLHTLPRTYIRMWSPQMPSQVFPRTDILMWSPQFPSHVVPKPAIAWSPELPSSCGPHNWHYMWSLELIWTKSKSQQSLSLTEKNRLLPCP